MFMRLQRKMIPLLAVFMLAICLVLPAPRAHAQVQMQYFFIGGSDPYLIAGADIPVIYSDDRAIGTKIASFEMLYSTDNINWHNVLELKSQSISAQFRLPIDPSITSVRIRVMVHYVPILGSDTYLERTEGPFKVLQPGETSDFQASANDDGSVTLTWNDNSNMESSYVIKRDGPDGTKYFNMQNTAGDFGPVATVDKATNKNKNTLYAYTVTPVIDKYTLPDNVIPGVETVFIWNKAPRDGLVIVDKINPVVQIPVLVGKNKVITKVPVIDLKPAVDVKIPDGLGPISKGGTQGGTQGDAGQPNIEALLEEAVKGSSDWAKADLKLAIAASLTTPSVLGNYQQPITREQFASIAVKLYEALSSKPAAAAAPNPFTDTVNVDVLKAFQLGIVTGVSATGFSPDASISRQELCVMLMRAVKAAKPAATLNISSSSGLADSDLIAPWALDAVRFAVNHAIMNGVGGGRIDPLGITTREQAILLVKRTFDAYK
ncbi:S-layer homology domain-containing protein [Paenibacillus anseongense]|uniref:S-layer homology domain-containing protein n=1 Tax=Paenibacillus anseongense TaxID=2682845 RepID=UPI002DBCE2B6|nr:S-layer homology domain-containing protein [Paenibacillus anseongense]MEC0267212.1 S-layer homology domain-containing protein [Paenibacillus anseongense]